MWIVNVDILDDPEKGDTLLERIHKVMGIDTYFVEDDDYYKRKPSVGLNGFSLVHFDTRRSRRLITPGYVERLNKAFGINKKGFLVSARFLYRKKKKKKKKGV